MFDLMTVILHRRLDLGQGWSQTAECKSGAKQGKHTYLLVEVSCMRIETEAVHSAEHNIIIIIIKNMNGWGVLSIWVHSGGVHYATGVV